MNNVAQTYFGQNLIFVRRQDDNGRHAFFRDEREGFIPVADPLAEITLVLGAAALISRETVFRVVNEQGDKIMTAAEVLFEAGKVFSDITGINDDERLAYGVKYILGGAHLLKPLDAVELYAAPDIKRGLFESLPTLDEMEADDPFRFERDHQIESLKACIGLN